MADIAVEVQRTAPADPMHPIVPSSYTEALDTVRKSTFCISFILLIQLQIRLAETFLGIAESLRKPRGALMQG